MAPMSSSTRRLQPLFKIAWSCWVTRWTRPSLRLPRAWAWKPPIMRSGHAAPMASFSRKKPVSRTIKSKSLKQRARGGDVEGVDDPVLRFMLTHA